jgi:hypothetical protein
MQHFLLENEMLPKRKKEGKLHVVLAKKYTPTTTQKQLMNIIQRFLMTYIYFYYQS